MAGMWVVHVEVTDEESYAKYLKGSSRIVPSYDGVFIARGGRYTVAEGQHYPRNVVVRFPSYERAVECYESDEYQSIVRIAQSASQRHLTILEVED